MRVNSPAASPTRLGLELFTLSDERQVYHGRELAMSQARVSLHVYRALLFGAPESWHFTVFGHRPWRLLEGEQAAAQRHHLQDHALFQPLALPLVHRWLGKPWRDHTERNVYVPRTRAERLDVMHFTGELPWGEQPLAARAEIFTALDFYSQRQDPDAAADLRRRTECRREKLHVLAISEFTARDAVEHLELPPERVRAIPLAVDRATFQPLGREQTDDAVRRRWNLPSRYALYVGALSTRKNVFTLLRALEMLNTGAAEKLPLVLTGAPGGGNVLRRRFLEARVRGALRHTPLYRLPPLDDPELATLYRGATLLVHPSTFEGFGFTVLEAMACGTPVVCGHHSSLVEVAGSAAWFVEDVTDAEGLAQAVSEVAGSDSQRATMRAAGFAQAARFSWERFERETFDFVRAATEGRF